MLDINFNEQASGMALDVTTEAELPSTFRAAATQSLNVTAEPAASVDFKTPVPGGMA